MASYTDGVDRQLILSLASTLRQLLKFTLKPDLQEIRNLTALSKQLNEWLETVGSREK